MTRRILLLLLSLSSVQACDDPSALEPTDIGTSTETETETEAETNAPSPRVDLQFSKPFTVPQWTWLLEQSGETWCADVQPGDFTNLEDEEGNPIDCWVGTGRECYQYLTFREDGSLEHEAAFVVRLPCGGEDTHQSYVGGRLRDRAWQFMGPDGSSDRFQVDGEDWLMIAEDHDIRVRVGAHSFLLQ